MTTQWLMPPLSCVPSLCCLQSLLCLAGSYEQKTISLSEDYRQSLEASHIPLARAWPHQTDVRP